MAGKKTYVVVKNGQEIERLNTLTAAKKLADMRKYQCEATTKSRLKMMADAEAGDPEAIARYEATLAKRRENYHKKKTEKEDIPA